ncbi:MAG TPA: capsular biosynthesis protein [Ruminococcaceae bacterium]|nr:capsular biosynthesis protein [Oscillospiraceae bacterium]
MRVIVTGAGGFIGKNLCAAFSPRPDTELFGFDRQDSEEVLIEELARADFIFHLAGVNRAEDDTEFLPGNRALISRITEHLAQNGKAVPILLSSSVQAGLDNPYGRSKLETEDCLKEYAEKTGAPVFIYRLPGVFGKWSCPFYNTVVATWCTQIAAGEEVRIDDPERELPLIYIDDVVSCFIDCVSGKVEKDADGFCHAEPVERVTLGGLYEILKGFKSSRENLTLPDFSNRLVKNLYATYLSFLPPDGFSYPLAKKSDDRGWLAEFIKAKGTGQIFISTTKPGFVRGNHWHHTKCEKFLVVAGEAEIKFRNVLGVQTQSYYVSSQTPQVVDIPPGYTHSIENVGQSELVTLFWSNEIFDSVRPDTFYEKV